MSGAQVQYSSYGWCWIECRHAHDDTRPGPSLQAPLFLYHPSSNRGEHLRLGQGQLGLPGALTASRFVWQRLHHNQVSLYHFSRHGSIIGAAYLWPNAGNCLPIHLITELNHTCLSLADRQTNGMM
jgi:hypothetical protein